MNTIQIFKNPEFGEVRTAGTPENPLFCLMDIRKALGLTQGHVRERLDDGVVSTEPISDSLGREQLANFVNEDGLYDVILDSRKPEAKKFRKWVTSEVLPSIRKSGGYVALNPNDTDVDILARAVLVAKETIDRKNKQISELTEVVFEKDQQLCEKDNQIKEKQQEIIEKTPGYNFSKAVETSGNSILIGELARILAQNGVKIGQKRLFEFLRSNGYFFKSGTQYNQPTQRDVEMGLFEIKKTVITASDGSQIIKNTTKVTPKGQIYFVNKFINNNNIFTQIKKEA